MFRVDKFLLNFGEKPVTAGVFNFHPCLQSPITYKYDDIEKYLINYWTAFLLTPFAHVIVAYFIIIKEVPVSSGNVRIIHPLVFKVGHEDKTVGIELGVTALTYSGNFTSHQHNPIVLHVQWNPRKREPHPDKSTKYFIVGVMSRISVSGNMVPYSL